MAYFSRSYRFRRWFYYYCRKRDVTALLASVVGISIAVAAFTEYPRFVLIAGVFYVALVITSFVLLINTRISQDQESRAGIEGIFQQMNNALFQGSPQTRFTLLCPDPLNVQYVVPYARFRVAYVDNTQDVLASKARFKRGMGIAGVAWQNANSPDRFCFQYFDFGGDEELMKQTFQSWKIPDEIIDELNKAYLLRVKAIICYAFLDPADKLLGILSIDLEEPPLRELNEGSGDLELDIDQNSFSTLADVLGNYLFRTLGQRR